VLFIPLSSYEDEPWWDIAYEISAWLLIVCLIGIWWTDDLRFARALRRIHADKMRGLMDQTRI